MKTINVTQARNNIYHLLKEINESHEPIEISGKYSNGVLISKEDWESINETLYFYSIKGMHESIKEGINTPIEECIKKLDW